MNENGIYSGGSGAGSDTSGANGRSGNDSYVSNQAYGNADNAGSAGNTDNVHDAGSTRSHDYYSGGSYSSNNQNNHYSNAEYHGYSTYQSDDNALQKSTKAIREKRQGGFFRRAVLSVCLGLIFGLFAGVGFYAVQQYYGLQSNNNVKEAALSQNVESIDTGIDSGTQESQSGIRLTDSDNIRIVSSDVSDVVEEVMPAMVSIVKNYTESGMNFFGQNYSEARESSGSGIIVAESDTELLIVTNYHVVSDATKLEVTFIDGVSVEAQVKGWDQEMDLAVLAISLSSLQAETKDAIAIATLGDSDNLKLGEPVIAIGNALGYGQSVTGGYISALNRTIELDGGSNGTFIQTDAAINPGNSGGALLNMSGEVIGINSNKIGGTTIEGMGYAIPISAAKPIIAELMMKETRSQVEDGQIGYMGISLQTITDQFASMYGMPQGVYVTGVETNSPADHAGMLTGDILVRFEEEKIASYEDLQRVLKYYGAGTTVKVSVMRFQNGEYQNVDLELTLGMKPSE